MKNSMNIKSLEEIPEKEEVYVDSNIFIYEATAHPLYSNSCSNFFRNMEDGKITGITSALTITETLHKLLIINLCKVGNLKPREALKLIKKRPTILSELKEPYTAVEKILELTNLDIAPLTKEVVDLTRRSMREELLMSNDAAHLATMRLNNIKNIATNDSDFEGTMSQHSE